MMASVLLVQMEKTIHGTAIDVSEAGIGFKGEERLRLGEIVKIISDNSGIASVSPFQETVRIVRIEEAKGGYYYGGTLSNNL